jgi:hypothetical protein
MSHLIHKTAIAAGIAFAMTTSVYAVDNLVVDGYAKNSSGETWTSSSGECVRTIYEDTQELLESCGYEIVVTESVEVDNKPVGADLAIVEETQVIKSGEVLADKTEVLAESFLQNLEFGFDSADLTAGDRQKMDGVITQLDPYRPMLRENVAHINVPTTSKPRARWLPNGCRYPVVVKLIRLQTTAAKPGAIRIVAW